MSWSRSISARALAALALVFGGCDLPMPDAHDGPRVVTITPTLGDLSLDRNLTLRIELDRRVAPSSVVDGVVEVTSGDNYVWLVQRIDVVRPALVVTPLEPLDPDIGYALRVLTLRDLDGRASTPTPRSIFQTSSAIARTSARVPVTYAEVAPVFAGCASIGCHVGSTAPLGLDLSSGRAVRATAIRVAAREERAAVDGYLATEVTAPLIGLSRIEPGVPARSYLLYTMLGDPHIAGAPMPPTGEPATLESLELVQRWITAGAATE